AASVAARRARASSSSSRMTTSPALTRSPTRASTSTTRPGAWAVTRISPPRGSTRPGAEATQSGFAGTGCATAASVLVCSRLRASVHSLTPYPTAAASTTATTSVVTVESILGTGLPLPGDVVLPDILAGLRPAVLAHDAAVLDADDPVAIGVRAGV